MRRPGSSSSESGAARPQPDLLLIGLRGSGKSTVALELAARQGRTHFDLDVITPKLLGCADVAEAWARHGEPGFRLGEAKALLQVLGGRGGGRIIALGGGTPTAPGICDEIEGAKREGRVKVAYLRCSPAELRRRLESQPGGAGAHRPSLTGADPLEEIDEVFRARDPLYARLATRVIEGCASVDDAVRRLADWQSW